MERTASQLTWWGRPGLEVRAGRLAIAGRDAESIAREHGTPLYVHDLVRVEEQARALQGALGRTGLRHGVRLALKAQREPAFLAFLRALGPPGSPESVGMDVCSPGEIRWALEHGWETSEISYTGTNLSTRDLDAVLDAGVHLNVDLLTQLDRVGRRAPGSTVGIRINPRIGAAFPGGGQSYAGDRPTKFGIYPERLDAALDIARHHDLTIDTVHVHAGYLYLTDALPVVDETMRRVAAATRMLMDAGCPIAEVNTGGGLGVPFRPGDRPLDLDAWAAVLAEHLGPLDVLVGTEPGEFLAKECAAHLAEVVSVEDRDGTTFVGLDTGWNVINEHFVYGIPFHPILCRAADAEPAANVTVAGHINEGNDLFAEDHPMPEVEEGDIAADPQRGFVQRVDGVGPLSPARPLVGLLHRPDMNDLPVAESWFRSQRVTEDIVLLVEDHLDPFFESNVWHVRGAERDLVVDTGNGIGDLRAELAPLVGDRPVVAVATHDHFDHIGGLHAFDERWCHAADADGIREPDGLALMRTDFRPGLEDEIRWYGYEPPERVITAMPREDFDVSGWRTPATEPTRLLGEGDVVDMGDRAFEVLHVPGHTAGSIALWDPASGLLFTGDTAALDDPLHAKDEEAFVASLRRLRALPVELVCAGHSRPFDRTELRSLIDEQLVARG